MSSSSKNISDLPAPDPNMDEMFGVDRNINMATIDDYLGIDGVVYRDMRMLCDTADFGSIGGDPDLTVMIDGFDITPLPLIGLGTCQLETSTMATTSSTSPMRERPMP
ncbi:MAG: hypothetical protein ACOYIK_05070 [Coriobacteriales bacterium]|jgi:hypothetical protein